MMRTTHVLALSLLPTAVVLGGVLRARGPQEGPPPGSVCFVDMQRCLDEYPAAQGELQRLRERWRGSLDTLEQRAQKLKEQENELAALDPSSEEFQRRSFDLETARMTLERERKYVADRINHERMQLLVRTYRSIQQAAEKVGRERGYAAILVIPTSLDDLPDDPKAALENLQLRTNLWTNPGYDVSEAVIAALQGS